MFRNVFYVSCFDGNSPDFGVQRKILLVFREEGAFWKMKVMFDFKKGWLNMS